MKPGRRSSPTGQKARISPDRPSVPDSGGRPAEAGLCHPFLVIPLEDDFLSHQDLLRAIAVERRSFHPTPKKREVERISMEIGYFFFSRPLRLPVVEMRDGHHALAKVALLIILAACLVSAGYSGETDTPPGNAGQVAEPLAGTAWHLAALRADNGSVVAPLPRAEPLIIFGEGGTLSGSAGCNAYSAPYHLNETGLVLGRVIATKTARTDPTGIMEQESAYLDLLRSAAGYRIVGDTLVVIDGNGRAILFFTAEP